LPSLFVISGLGLAITFTHPLATLATVAIRVRFINIS